MKSGTQIFNGLRGSIIKFVCHIKNNGKLMKDFNKKVELAILK